MSKYYETDCSWQLIESTNIKYKLCKSQNYLYDCYHSISRTKKKNAKLTKRPINKHRVNWKNGKTQINGDLSTRFFLSNTFLSNARLNWTKN